jgi:surface carbohydrate biosynthesis protein (TIGR04326 family)
MKKIIIWDLDYMPEMKNSSLILWNSKFSNYNSNIVLSINDIIEFKKEYYKSKYLSFLYDLQNYKINNSTLIENFFFDNKFSIWWMSLFHEKCNYHKSKYINDIIKIFALEDYISANVIEIIEIHTSDKKLSNALTNWFKNKSIVVISKRSKNIFSIRNLFKINVPELFKTILFLVHYFCQRYFLAGVGLNKWNNSSSNITFVSYFTNITNRNSFSCNYWGDLPKQLSESKIKINWLHILPYGYNTSNTKDAKILLKNYNLSNYQNHAFLDSFLSLDLIINTIRQWFIINKISKNILNSKDFSNLRDKYLWDFLSDDWARSFHGKELFLNLLHYNLFKISLKKLKKQKHVFYLQENQGWEFALNHLLKLFNHGTIYGVPHSSIRYWDLRYFFDSRLYNNIKLSMPYPDVIAVNSEMAYRSLLVSGVPLKKLYKVEALRYSYLNNIIILDKKSNNNSNSIKLLVLGDYSNEFTKRLLLLLNATLVLMSNQLDLVVYYKPHPHSTFDFSSINSNFILVNEQFNAIVNKYDIVLASNNTSAAIDALCVGLPLITYYDYKDLNFSPLIDYKNVRFISSKYELIECLKKLKLWAKIENQPNYFYLSGNYVRWHQIFNN